MLCTSTIGESPVTVIVSSIEPTLRSASTVAVNVPGSSTPSRRTDWNPVKREVDRVGAGPQIDDTIAAGLVGDRRADLFDQCRARRFDRHSWKHGARRVLDDAGNRRLGVCG